MQRKSYHPLVLTIIGLAIVGLGYQLVVSPGAFISRILITIGIIAVLFFVVTRFVMPRIMRNNGMYVRAAKSSQAKKQAPKQPISFKKAKKEKRKRISRPLVKRQSNVKLTVIEGKKNKKKSRALF